MSSESSTPRVPSHEALTTQLQAYGQWLERRSDVALAPAPRPAGEVAGGPTGPEVDHLPGPDDQPDPPRRQRLLAGAAAAVALVALAAVGVGMLADDGDGDGDRIVTGPASGATAADDSADTPTSDLDGRPDPPAAGTESDAPSSADAAVGLIDPTQGSATGDDAAGASPDDAAPSPDSGDGGDGTPADPAGDGAGGSAETDEGIPDIVLTPSTAELPSESPTTGGPWRPESGESMFVAPSEGASIDPNASNVLQAHAVSGATGYRFEAWQSGVQILDVTMPEPRLLLPSQLVTGAGPFGPMEAGSMQLVVTALDASGQVMASGEITVTVRGHMQPTPGVTTNPFPTNP